jgi:hypothetical protein
MERPPVRTPHSRWTWPAALAVALATFALYRATLLPDFDLGDTASLQVMTGSPVISPRDGYPVYFALTGAVHRLRPGSPAYAGNLASAAAAAAAAGAIVVLGVEIAGALGAAVAASLLFAGSYTFWSQAIIAEVYTLHVLLTVLTLLLALRWYRRPGLLRLAPLFGLYALAFGNHLSMILLAPALTVFLLISAPGGWRTLVRPGVVALAIVAVLAGASPYLWNVLGAWHSPDPPAGAGELLATVWFDLTKSDWRETMVMGVPPSMLGERLRMYAFDVHQQFGWPVIPVALAGAARLLAVSPHTATLLLLAYLGNLIFALGYNVGDAYVFLLVSHLIVALFVAPVVAWAGARLRWRALPATVAVAFAVGRIVLEYPALDRSGDRRPVQTVAALVEGLDDRHALFLPDLNWQLQNGLTYYGKHHRRDLAYVRMPEVLLHLPALIRDNEAAGRETFATARARADAEALYGPLLESVPDPRVRPRSLLETVQSLPPGTRYVMTVLRPAVGVPMNRQDAAEALRWLTGSAVASLPETDYVATAGLLGESPLLYRAGPDPFRAAAWVGGVRVEVRMESWLVFDTIRRMGFGRVTAGLRPLLIVEQGVSLGVFDADASLLATEYRGNIHAPQPRYILRVRR